MIKKLFLILCLNTLCNAKSSIASFTKLLEHNSKTGLLTQNGQKNFDKLIKALETGNQEDFNVIERAPNIRRLWYNPQSAFSPLLVNLAPESFQVPPPPALESKEAAAELIELYLMALCRIVPFDQYANHETIKMTASLLTQLGSAYKGPKKNNRVDTSVLFRGNTTGDLIGPYISQFFLLPLIPLFPSEETDVGAHNLDLRICKKDRLVPSLDCNDFAVNWNDFVTIQNGNIPDKFSKADLTQSCMRYIKNGRDLAWGVYTDAAYDLYYYALNVLVGFNFPYSKQFPYNKGIIKNENVGSSMGLSDVYCLIASVCTQAYKVCWYYKWRKYMRLRPEAMAGLVHQSKISNILEFNLDESLFKKYNNINLLDLILQNNQKISDQSSTYLLPLVYPEGSPTHPSYPAAHATIAGACTTILKAFFDESTPIASRVDPVEVDPNDNKKLRILKKSQKQLTVGGELDKLASNIAQGRSWAGIHYRSDNQAGLELGQEVAIRLLQQHIKTYHEKGFEGFKLTKRNGKRILITCDAIKEL